jgi:hypothetical protein
MHEFAIGFPLNGMVLAVSRPHAYLDVHRSLQEADLRRHRAGYGCDHEHRSPGGCLQSSTAAASEQTAIKSPCRAGDFD